MPNKVTEFIQDRSGKMIFEMDDGSIRSFNPSRPQVKPSRVATRIYSTQLQTATTAAAVGYGFPGPTTVTATMLADVETTFDAVSVIFMNAGASTINLTNLTVGTPTQVSAFTSNLESTVQGTFNTSNTVSIPSGTTTNPSIIVSDKILISSSKRTDSGTRPLLCINAQFSTASDGSTSFTYWFRNGSKWGTAPSFTDENQRVLGTNLQPNAVSINSTSVNPNGISPIVGFVYWARGKVITIAAAGNSILAGNTFTDSANRSQLIKAVQKVSTLSNPFEYMVVGLPGTQSSLYCSLLEKIITTTAPAGALKPTVGIIHGFNTNSTAFLDSKVLNQPSTSTMAALDNIQAISCHFNGIPRQADAVSSYFTNDAVRLKYNLELTGDIIDAASIISNVNNPSLFQINLVQNDLIHPTEEGDNKIVSEGYIPYLNSL
jgi:hypothetical protein